MSTTTLSAHLPTPPRSTATRSMVRCVLLSVGLTLLGLAALAVDVPLVQWARQGNCPREVFKLLALCEVFGHAIGIGLIVMTLAVLDPPRRASIPRVLAASLGSGLVANVFKLCVARVRPIRYDLSGNGWDTFLGWFPLASNASWQQSFPSSHSATSAGLAIALSALYPRGRWWFATLAVLAVMQRVVGQSHFLSDACWGAAVGCLFAGCCVYSSGIARFFDRIEARWQQRHVASAPLEATAQRAKRPAA